MNYIIDIYHGLIPPQHIDYNRLVELLKQYPNPESREHQMVAHIIDVSFEHYLQQAHQILTAQQKSTTRTQPVVEFDLA